MHGMLMHLKKAKLCLVIFSVEKTIQKCTELIRHKSLNKWSQKIFSKYITSLRCGITNENGWMKAYVLSNVS